MKIAKEIKVEIEVEDEKHCAVECSFADENEYNNFVWCRLFGRELTTNYDIERDIRCQPCLDAFGTGE